MLYSLNFQIREQLARYLSHEMSLHDFKTWFFAETWNADQHADTTVCNLIYGIKLDLAEFSQGDWTEDELRGLLRASYLEKQAIGSPLQFIQYGTSQTNMLIYPSVTYSGLSADKKFSGVSLS
jgi:hypothetical protein